MMISKKNILGEVLLDVFWEDEAVSFFVEVFVEVVVVATSSGEDDDTPLCLDFAIFLFV